MVERDEISKSRGPKALLFGGILVVAAAAAYTLFGPGFGSKSTGTDPTLPIFEVRRGPLVISVTESGTIQARDLVIIKSEVEGNMTIIFIKEEGTHVEAGELLVELDASELEDKRVDRDISVQSAEASFVSARENLAVVENQARSDVAEAELNFRFAKEDLQQYVNGEFPRQRKEAESKITLAEEELKNAAETLRWSEKLFEGKYISQTELDRDRLAENRARLDHELAVSGLGLLDDFTHKRQLDEYESNIQQTEMALERATRKARADVTQAEAQLRAREAEFNRQKSHLAELDLQIKKCKIFAPSAGMVVYATTGKSSWRGNDDPIHEGRSVRQREELIHLPTTNSMMADLKIHESSLDKVKVGQQVNITVDALPGRRFSGKVAKIAPLPDAQSVWMNPDLKVYPTEIHLAGEIAEVRTGMNCRAEIIVERLDDALYVPIQAVVRVAGKPCVWIASADNGPERRDVVIGLDNNQMIHITKGLEEGELVLLAPPLDEGTSTRLTQEPAIGPDGVAEGGAPPMGSMPPGGMPEGMGDRTGRQGGPGSGGSMPEGMGRRGAGGERPEGMRRRGAGGERSGRGGGENRGGSERPARDDKPSSEGPQGGGGEQPDAGGKPPAESPKGS